jgi:TusA-related sulfurtransferase
MNKEYVKPKRVVYIFDSSAFITLHQYSAKVIELPKEIWDELAKMMAESNIISHIYVYDEIVSESTENPDMITKWLIPKKGSFEKESVEQAIIVALVVDKFPKLIDPEQEKEQADPWIIAQAITLKSQTNLLEDISYVVVTQENPNSTKKIPAACKSFGVESISLKDFFEKNNIKIQKSK